jgi:hypothetical protein
LLTAQQKGQVQLNTFVDERLLPHAERKVKFRDALPKNKPLTFASLYEVNQKNVHSGKQKTIKADRKILQRLITAYEAGRNVDLSMVLKHELMPVPPALAEMNGTLRSGSKTLLLQALTREVPCPPSLDEADLGDNATLVVDGQALICAIGKPQQAATFGDLADVFIKSLHQAGRGFKRTDVLFDRYNQTSIKTETRRRRGKGSQPVRKSIDEGRNVPLPAKWENYISHPDNKADLAQFLSRQIILHAPADQTIVAAGGFSDVTQVESSNPNTDVRPLEASHEEADTRIILHCVHSEHEASSIVVSSRDTDVAVLLLAHYHRIKCPKVWIKNSHCQIEKVHPCPCCRGTHSHRKRKASKSGWISCHHGL